MAICAARSAHHRVATQAASGESGGIGDGGAAEEGLCRRRTRHENWRMARNGAGGENEHRENA